MAMRLLCPLAALVLQVACVERTISDDPLPFDPATEERTNAEILRDFCDLWVACELDAPVLDEPTCLWYFDYINTGFEMNPKKPPECAVALWDQLACNSLANSCEGFKASWDFQSANTDHRCDEPFSRFRNMNCQI